MVVCPQCVAYVGYFVWFLAEGGLTRAVLFAGAGVEQRRCSNPLRRCHVAFLLSGDTHGQRERVAQTACIPFPFLLVRVLPNCFDSALVTVAYRMLATTTSERAVSDA